MARPLQTCWNIHLTFHSSSITDLMEMTTSLQKMKREQSLLSSNMIASVMSAFAMPVTSLQKLIAAMDDEYPILEYLIIWHPDEGQSSILMFPETLQAPHLRHLVLLALPFR
jgi:hypothetical protein